MAGRLRIRRPGRPRRGDMSAGAVVLFVAFCVLVTATTFFIEHELRPTGSFFGVPGRLDFPILIIAVVGIALTSINTFGGFAVTRRMLMMFQK